jgi:hypothetical protein
MIPCGERRAARRRQALAHDQDNTQKYLRDAVRKKQHKLLQGPVASISL